MKKFFMLFKKELRELLSPQVIVPFFAMTFLFFSIGKFIGSETKNQEKEVTVAILDLDESQTTNSFVEIIKQNNYKVDYYKDAPTEEIITQIKENGEKFLIVFPEATEENLRKNKQQEIKVYSVFHSLSLFNNIDSGITTQIPAILNEYLSSQLIQANVSSIDQIFLKNPITPNNFVILKDKITNVDPTSIISHLYSQTLFIPIVLFLVISLASQLVAGAIATEKENKTLETLLSTPINRKLIVAAKLLAAGTVSLVMAILYLIGIQSYTSGITGESQNSVKTEGIKQALESLNLTLGFTDFVLLGACLFLGILVALSIAFIIGSFAEDTKSSQALTTPLMIVVLIPYLLTMLFDINQFAVPLRIFIYAIPFTHTFTAANNIFLQRYDLVIYGIIYVLALVCICIYFASKIFTSEKILTMEIGFKKKKKENHTI
ncbi:ABC transporter permease [Candidatus Dojkabacteria bacterium]|nr:ABC transporter permease [Candidatus Dojkabacteria bacterium]